MAAVNQDIGLDPTDPYFSGDSLNIDLTVYQSDGVTPEDIGTAAIKWQAHPGAYPDGGAPALSKATGGQGITIVDGPNGKCRIAIAPGDTDGMEGMHYHEAEVTFIGPVVSTVMSGRWLIRRDAV